MGASQSNPHRCSTSSAPRHHRTRRYSPPHCSSHRCLPSTSPAGPPSPADAAGALTRPPRATPPPQPTVRPPTRPTHPASACPLHPLPRRAVHAFPRCIPPGSPALPPSFSPAGPSLPRCASPAAATSTDDHTHPPRRPVPLSLSLSRPARPPARPPLAVVRPPPRRGDYTHVLCRQKHRRVRHHPVARRRRDCRAATVAASAAVATSRRHHHHPCVVGRCRRPRGVRGQRTGGPRRPATS